MSLDVMRRVVVAGVVFVGLFLVPAAPAAATTTGPTVIAVHRNGAIDMSGQTTFGAVATMTLGAGNWTITATATIQAIASVSDVECQLVAGTDFYKSVTIPTSGGVGSSQPMVLLLAHHFASTGTAMLKCKSNGWLGDVLIRDVHVTAVKVAQLYTGDVTYGSGSPRGYFAQDTSARGYSNLAYQDVQDVSVAAGTYLVQAAAWGGSVNNGDRVNCNIATGSPRPDQFAGDFETSARGLAMVDVVTLTNPGSIFEYCADTNGAWYVYGSAISAMQIGTLKYGPIGGSMTTTGSGIPVVVGGYNDSAGGVAASQALQTIAAMPLSAGNWFVTAKSSFFASTSVNTTCQLRLNGVTDQGRVVLDSGNNMINWMDMSLTKKLSATASASIACGQSASTGNVAYLHIRIFAIKAGALTDTTLN